MNLERLTVIYLLLSTSVVLYVLFLAFWPVTAIEVQPQPYVLENTEVAAGEFIEYHIFYCRYTDVDSKVIHQMVNLDSGTRFRINDEYQFYNAQASDGLRLREGCDEVVKAVRIPSYVEQGRYYLEEVVSYQVNPLQLVTYNFITEDFKVVK